jgi:hypothetical protein
MGVTINFEGKLKSETDYQKVLKTSEEFAKENQMPFTFFEESEKLLQRVKDEEDWDYVGKTKGIRIQPDENSDPLLLEFDKDNYIQEYCKTQFADIEIHIKIIGFLRNIETFFDKLIIFDEGEYWETNNVELLQEHIDNCFKEIEKEKKENKNLDGPYRLEDGRIIDLMSSE